MREVLQLKIVVMSDSHGDWAAVRKVVQLQKDAELFIHLGDGEQDMRRALQCFPFLIEKHYFLKGNCDYGDVLEQTRKELTLPLPFGHGLFAAHGDHFQVKFGTARLAYEAGLAGADIVLYGHTHVRDNRYEDGLYFINPGSLGCPRDGKPPSYAVISVSEKGILANHAEL